MQAALVERFGTDGPGTRGEAPWILPRTVSDIYSAIEVACFDIMGKATGRPVVTCSAGVCATRVAASLSISFSNTQVQAVQEALSLTPMPPVATQHAKKAALYLHRRGRTGQGHVRRIWLQVHQVPRRCVLPDEEVNSMLALRGAFGPRTPLRPDPNAIWSVVTPL